MSEIDLDALTDQADREGIVQLVVGAVIADEDRVLLLRRPVEDFMGGIFELPSGKVEPGERLDDALAREVKEESGLELTEITAYLGHFDYTSSTGKPSRQFNFAVTLAATEPVVLAEHDAHQWTTPTADAPVTDAVRTVLASFVEQVRPSLSD